MPRFSPADLRTGRLHFLFDLAWGGQTYRLAESMLTPTIDGTEYEYSDGLRFGGSWEDRIDMFSATPSGRTASVTLSLAELVDVPQRIADGHPLGSATGTLSLWLSGTTTTHKLLVGSMRRVEYGSKDEPVRATVEEIPLRAPGRIPGTNQRLSEPNAVNWNLTMPDTEGQYYPIIFGYPGGPAGFGSPWFWTNSSTRSIVCGHKCIAGTVVVVNASTDATESVTLVYEHDSTTGVERSVGDAPTLWGTAPHDEVKEPHYVRWTDGNAGGVASATNPTEPMRGAGEILAWMLERSGARVDFDRLRATQPKIDVYKLDAAVVPGKEARVSPMEWIQAHILPILPLSSRMGTDGLYFFAWPFDARKEDAVADLSADDHQVERVGQVEYSDADDVYQSIRFDYAHDYRAGTYQETLLYTGDRQDLVSDTTAVLDRDLERAFIQRVTLGEQEPRALELSSDVVLDDATAHLVCRYLARRHGRQTRLVRYEADPEFAWLDPGDVITLTDEDLALTSVVAVVETAVWTEDEHIGLALRIL